MSGECDPIHEIARKILEERGQIIELFCKTFFVSQEPRSPEELRALFEIAELHVTHNKDMSQTFSIKFKEFK